MAFDRIEDIIEDYRRGKMVLLVDDEDRENEGDLLLAADCCSPQAISFMAREARGLICLTLTDEHCQRLGWNRWCQVTAVYSPPRSRCPSKRPRGDDGHQRGRSCAHRSGRRQPAGSTGRLGAAGPYLSTARP